MTEVQAFSDMTCCRGDQEIAVLLRDFMIFVWPRYWKKTCWRLSSYMDKKCVSC